MPIAVIAMIAVLGILVYSLYDGTPRREHNSASQTKNPTNSPGTTKQP